MIAPEINPKTSLQSRLQQARKQAVILFETAQQRELIRPGITERQASDGLFNLAQELFGIRQYWHKRIVRAGENTILPYRFNPPDRILEENDTVYVDFGPVFDETEADLGRTYVLGQPCEKNAEQQQLVNDLEIIWNTCQTVFRETPEITGQQLYQHMQELASHKNYTLADWHCGHLIGMFPHEKLLGDDRINYICPENIEPMRNPDAHGSPRHWILEVHLIHASQTFGGFYEDLL